MKLTLSRTWVTGGSYSIATSSSPSTWTVTTSFNGSSIPKEDGWWLWSLWGASNDKMWPCLQLKVREYSGQLQVNECAQRVSSLHNAHLTLHSLWLQVNSFGCKTYSATTFKLNSSILITLNPPLPSSTKTEYWLISLGWCFSKYNWALDFFLAPLIPRSTSKCFCWNSSSMVKREEHISSIRWHLLVRCLLGFDDIYWSWIIFFHTTVKTTKFYVYFTYRSVPRFVACTPFP